MRRFTVLIFVFAATFSSLYSQSADEKLADILNSGDLFMLEEQYPQLKDKLQYPMLNILTESLLSDASNKPQEAYEKINELLTKYQAEAGFASAQTMFLVKCRNLAAMGKYAQAADELQYFMGEVSQHMDSLYLEAYKDAYRMYNSLRDTPAEELIRPREDCVIKYEADIFDNGNSLMFVPVTIDGKQERFILDTGCPGGAFMSERFAEEHNVRIVYDSLPIQGVGKGFGKLGVVDSIKIGNMIFKNLTVTIALPNAAIDTVYQVDAVLGQDLMKAAGELQIYPNEKKIIFPLAKTPLPPTGQNMLFINDHPYLKTYSNNERLIMHFDTGNSGGDLHYNYYNDHKDEVENTGFRETKQFGGYGGVNTIDIFRLPYFPLKVGSKQFILKEVPVNINPVWANQGNESGALGMSFISSFDKITISFDKMFVDVE